MWPLEDTIKSNKIKDLSNYNLFTVGHSPKKFVNYD